MRPGSKSLWLAALALALCLLGAPNAWAEEDDEVEFSFVWDFTSTAEPQIQAAAAALIDASSGRVLWQQNGDLPLPPASTGKILTAITALDLAELDEVYTITSRAAAVGESSINLRANETLTLADLIQGALVHSGNDACFAIGEGVAGTEPLFVYWLNLKAQLLGAYSAEIKNTNGLPAEGHEISAIDLAQIARYALADEFFAEVVGSKQVTFGAGTSTRTYRNTNKLLWHDDDVTGVKTGTTDAAGPCLVTSMRVGDTQLISVVFNSPDRYGESMRLLNFGANSYYFTPLLAERELAAYVPVTNGLAAGVLVAAAGESWCAYHQEELDAGLELQWRLPEALVAPVAAGQHVGSLVVVNAEGEQLAAVSLVTAAAVEAAPATGFWPRIKAFLVGD